MLILLFYVDNTEVEIKDLKNKVEACETKEVTSKSKEAKPNNISYGCPRNNEFACTASYSNNRTTKGGMGV